MEAEKRKWGQSLLFVILHTLVSTVRLTRLGRNEENAAGGVAEGGKQPREVSHVSTSHSHLADRRAHRYIAIENTVGSWVFSAVKERSISILQSACFKRRGRRFHYTEKPPVFRPAAFR